MPNNSDTQRMHSIISIVANEIDILIDQELILGKKILSATGKELLSTINLEELNPEKEEVLAAGKAIGQQLGMASSDATTLAWTVWLKLQLRM